MKKEYLIKLILPADITLTTNDINDLMGEHASWQTDDDEFTIASEILDIKEIED